MSCLTLGSGEVTRHKSLIQRSKGHCPMIVVFSSLTRIPCLNLREHLQMRKFQHFPWRILIRFCWFNSQYKKICRIWKISGRSWFPYLLHDLWKQNFENSYSCWRNESSSDLFGWNLNHDGRKKSQVTGQPVNLRVFEWGSNLPFSFEIERISNYLCAINCNLVGGWTNPSEKYDRQNGFIFPNFRDENKKYLKPPPSIYMQFYSICFLSKRRIWPSIFSQRTFTILIPFKLPLPSSRNSCNFPVSRCLFTPFLAGKNHTRRTEAPKR